MWRKKFKDGTAIDENRDKGLTWMKTPLDNIFMCILINEDANGKKARYLFGGYEYYWHSRSAIAMDGKPTQIVAERIQGQRKDGKWDTITWNGHEYLMTIEDRAIGKPRG